MSIDLIKENSLTLNEERSRQYPVETIIDEDYVDELVLLTNTPVQAECMLHSLKQAARGIGLHVNSNKTEFMCFNQNGVISTLNDKPLKLVDHFTYRGSNISFTESDANIYIGKVWIPIVYVGICSVWTLDVV